MFLCQHLRGERKLNNSRGPATHPWLMMSKGASKCCPEKQNETIWFPYKTELPLPLLLFLTLKQDRIVFLLYFPILSAAAGSEPSTLVVLPGWMPLPAQLLLSLFGFQHRQFQKRCPNFGRGNLPHSSC